jgi:serine/threonine-protein kinase
MGPVDESKQERLLRLAESVADGADVDWSREALREPQLAGGMKRLRTIASISQMCHAAAERVQDAAPAVKEQSANPNESSSTAPTWGHLSLLERIGTGAFSEVHRAHDPTLDHEVALKLLKEGSGATRSQRFLREAQRLAQIRHPNVITVHGVDVRDGRVGIWTELLRGQTLEQSLEERGVYGADEAALIGIELCSALAAIHGAGLVHGDIKCSNVMREEGGRIVLMDFGSVREDSPAAALEAGSFGSPLAMAPEVLDGGKPTRDADIYQLGALLYRLTSRAYPVESDDLRQLTAKKLKGEITPLRDRRANLPSAFVQIVTRALDADPKRRFRSVGEMEKALHGELGGTAPERRKRRRRVGAVWAALAVAGLALVTWGVGSRLTVASIRVETALYRMDGDAPQRLDVERGASLRPGDSLFLTLESPSDVHVYVLNEAEEEPGVVNTLFPDPELELANPVPGGVRHSLPAESRADGFWEVATDGGTERILIVASREPRGDLENLAILSATSSDFEIDPTKVGQLGMRSIALRKPASGQSSALQLLARKLEREETTWWKLIELDCDESVAERSANRGSE